jgi:hypothetical protein
MSDALERLAAAVHGWETRLQDQVPAPESYLESQPLRWMVLTADLPAATVVPAAGSVPAITVPSVPTSPNANPAAWQASGNGGAGGYSVDTTLAYAVAETTGTRSYPQGSWLLCRPILSANGTLLEPIETGLSFFELTGAMTFPDLSTAPSDHYDRSPQASASAKRLTWGQAQPSDQTYLGAPVFSWYVADGEPAATIYFDMTQRGHLSSGVIVYTDHGRYALGPPMFGIGDRVLCRLAGANPSNLNWQVIEYPRPMSCWGTLQTQLNPGSSATVSLWFNSGFPGLNITAWDWLLATGTNLPYGTKVKVEYFPQDGKWWVTAAQCSSC